jgi:hypothetical protein
MKPLKMTTSPKPPRVDIFAIFEDDHPLKDDHLIPPLVIFT